MRMLSLHLRENWESFSDKLFPGSYEGAALSAEAYDYLSWPNGWKLELLGQDAAGYAWSDVLYLNCDSEEIVSGASGPRERP